MHEGLLDELADLASMIAADARTVELDGKGIREIEKYAKLTREYAEKLESSALFWASEARGGK